MTWSKLGIWNGSLLWWIKIILFKVALGNERRGLYSLNIVEALGNERQGLYSLNIVEAV